MTDFCHKCPLCVRSIKRPAFSLSSFLPSGSDSRPMRARDFRDKSPLPMVSGNHRPCAPPSPARQSPPPQATGACERRRIAVKPAPPSVAARIALRALVPECSGLVMVPKLAESPPDSDAAMPRTSADNLLKVHI